MDHGPKYLRADIIKHLGENERENLHNFGLGQDF